MPEGIQRYPRTKMVLPLRVWLDEPTREILPPQWAHTIDISQIGCRLGGLRTELCPGQTIALQRGQQKFLFVSSGASTFWPMKIRQEPKRLTTEGIFGQWDFR